MAAVPSTAAGIAEAVASKQVTAREVLEHFLAAIDARESEINAFNLVTADAARAQADAIDAEIAAGRPVGPLAGVPIALKDNMCTRGVPTTCSSRILEGWKPPYDATVVARLSDLGAISVGKTNLDEFAHGGIGFSSAGGQTRNPHDPRRHPAGRICPRFTAMISRTTPVAVQTAKAMTEDSRPKAPPVRISGPLMLERIRPGSATPPETMPEKIADCV